MAMFDMPGAGVQAADEMHESLERIVSRGAPSAVAGQAVINVGSASSRMPALKLQVALGLDGKIRNTSEAGPYATSDQNFIEIPGFHPFLPWIINLGELEICIMQKRDNSFLKSKTQNQKHIRSE